MRGLSKGDIARIVAAAFSIAMALLGCDGPQTQVITMSSDSPAGSNSTRATITDGLATFQCIESIADACQYVLFVSECADQGAQSGKRVCAARILQEFALKAGTSKRIAALPEDFEFCVGHGIRPAIPACLK